MVRGLFYHVTAAGWHFPNSPQPQHICLNTHSDFSKHMLCVMLSAVAVHEAYSQVMKEINKNRSFCSLVNCVQQQPSIRLLYVLTRPNKVHVWTPLSERRSKTVYNFWTIQQALPLHTATGQVRRDEKHRGFLSQAHFIMGPLLSLQCLWGETDKRCTLFSPFVPFIASCASL